MQRLGAAAWPALVQSGHARAYDRSSLGVGIVHLGAGAFFRAHGASYTDAVLASGDLRWGIIGVSLRHADVRDALRPQDALYTLLERDSATLTPRAIGALVDVLAAPFENDSVRRVLGSPSTVIVTLTITEKAYCLDADGNLDLSNPAVADDLHNPSAPRSAIGWLAATLVERRAAGNPPYTVLACDNLRDNGHTLRRLVLAYTQRAFPADAAWLADAVAFPNTMVDRIVPRTIPADLVDARAAHGFEDAAPVRCEPFKQWVIEDFAGVRPEWEIAGARFVGDVRPFENAKLRLLNGAHTALALFGVLLGHATIAQAAGDADIASFVRRLMTDELAPTLAPQEGLDPEAYQAMLWPRFANAALGHATRQVATDTSAKLAQRHLPALRERRAAQQPCVRLALVIAGWIRYLAASDEAGIAYPIDDPLAEPLGRMVAAWRSDARRCVQSVVSVASVFGDLRDDAELVRAVTSHLEVIAHGGVRTALRAAT